MPYRVRPIRWELLVNPSMAGLREEAQANENLARYVAGAGEDIGRGIVRKRQEGESRRRHDEEMRLRAERHNLDVAEYNDKLLEREAMDDWLLEGVQGAGEELQANPTQENAQRFWDRVGKVGGPEAGARKMDAKSEAAVARETGQDAACGPGG